MCAWEVHLKSDKGSSFTATPCCELPLPSEEVPSDEQDFYHSLQVLHYAFLSLLSQGYRVDCESLEVQAVAQSDSIEPVEHCEGGNKCSWLLKAQGEDWIQIEKDIVKVE